MYTERRRNVLVLTERLDVLLAVYVLTEQQFQYDVIELAPKKQTNKQTIGME